MMAQRKERSAGRTAPGKQTWRQWITEFGAQVRQVRELLGLSQEQVARAAGVSQGAVSRFEGGRGLSTPLVGILKINLALAHAIKQLDNEMLAPEMKQLLRHLEILQLPDDPGMPVRPVQPVFKGFRVSPNEELTRVIKLYHDLPESRREAFLSVIEATIVAMKSA
jgi:transcriptional regulator with XRE-family HTH domain